MFEPVLYKNDIMTIERLKQPRTDGMNYKIRCKDGDFISDTLDKAINAFRAAKISKEKVGEEEVGIRVLETIK